MATKSSTLLSLVPTETMECPLCLGKGELKRSEVLDRLGVKDLSRVAQLSAEEAFRLAFAKFKHDEQSAWQRFETELAKRTAAIEERHRAELLTTTSRIKEFESAAKVAGDKKALEMERERLELENKLRTERSQKEDLNRRVEDYLREVGTLRSRNQELEAEMSKVARVGRREETDFATEARSWPGICISDKLPKNGDYLLSFRDPSGEAMEPTILIDNKDKTTVAEADTKKIVRDAKERRCLVAILVTKDESQLRQIDRDCRWGQEDGVWLLRTTRTWLPRDLEVLKPVFERMRTEGPDFLQRNAALGTEIRRTLTDIDGIEKELGKAAKAIDSATSLTVKYRIRLQGLCNDAAGTTNAAPALVAEQSVQ